MTRKEPCIGTCTYVRPPTWDCAALRWSWRRDCASRDWTSREQTFGSKTRDWRLRLAGECMEGGSAMPQRVRCILRMGVVTGLIGLLPVQCQQQTAEPKVVDQQQSGTGQPRAVQQQPVPNAYPFR